MRWTFALFYEKNTNIFVSIPTYRGDVWLCHNAENPKRWFGEYS